jgi:hypothetical protein
MAAPAECVDPEVRQTIARPREETGATISAECNRCEASVGGDLLEEGLEVRPSRPLVVLEAVASLRELTQLFHEIVTAQHALVRGVRLPSLPEIGHRLPPAETAD